MQKRDRESQQGEQPEQEEEEKSPASESPPVKKKPTAVPSAVDASDAPPAAEVPAPVATASAAVAAAAATAAAAAELKEVWFKFGRTVSFVELVVDSYGDDLIEKIVNKLVFLKCQHGPIAVSLPESLANKLKRFCLEGSAEIDPTVTLDSGFFHELSDQDLVVTERTPSSVAVKVRLDHTVATIEGLRLGKSTVGDLKFQAVRVLSGPNERTADYSLFFDPTQPTIVWGSAAGSADWLDKFCEGIPAASADPDAEKSPRKLKGDVTLDQDFFRVVKGNVEITLVDERTPPAPNLTVLVRNKYSSGAPAKHFQFNIDDRVSDLFRSCCDFFLPGADSQNVGQLQLVADGDWPALSCFVTFEGKLYLDRGAVLDQAFASVASRQGNSLVLVHQGSPALSSLHFVNVYGLGKSGPSEKRIFVKVGMPVWEVLSRIRAAFGPSKRNNGAYDLVLPNEFARPLEMEDAAWEEFLRCFRPSSTLKPDSKLTQAFISVFSSPGGSRLQAFIHAEIIKTESFDTETELFEREESALQMFKALLFDPSKRTAPALGQNYGAGKTALSFRFREFAEKPEFLAKLRAQCKDKELNELLGAVYVGVKFFSGSFLVAEDIQTALGRADQALNTQLECTTGMPCNTPEERRAMQEVLGRKILLHFDEVQLFETEKSPLTLYHFWNWAIQRAAEFGNLYILSGRSKWLFFMGQGFDFPGKPPSGPPHALVPIKLPLLSEESIAKFLKNRRINEAWINEKLVRFLKLYSAGVPRQVEAWRPETQRPPDSDLELHRFFANCADNPSLRKDLLNNSSSMGPVTYQRLWAALASAAWARVVLPANLFIEDEGVARTVPDAISYAGFYREEADGGFIVRAPLWSFVVNRPEIATLAMSANTGNRLEGGVFSMRLLLSQPRNWRDLGLAVLEEQGVPFNFKEVSLVLLPKIYGDDSRISEAKKLAAKAEKAAAKAKKENDDHARACATVFENKTTESRPEQAAQEVSWTIHRDSFHIFCEVLKLGVFHRSIQESSFADGTNRVGDRHLLCTQEKNFTEPIDKDAVLDEMKKCRVEGFTVTLLIICMAGHTSFNGFETDKDAIVEDSNCVGVKAIVLSRQSVINFLGLHFIELH